MGNFAENLNLGNRFGPPPPVINSLSQTSATLYVQTSNDGRPILIDQYHFESIPFFKFGPIRTQVCLRTERPVKQTKRQTRNHTNKQTRKHTSGHTLPTAQQKKPLKPRTALVKRIYFNLIWEKKKNIKKGKLLVPQFMYQYSLILF